MQGPSILGNSPPSELRPGPPPGLEPGRLHEVHAAADDRAAALAFALTFALTQAPAHRAPLFLIRPRGGGRGRARLLGEGLAGLGIDPARLVLVETAEEAALLRAGLDAARCPALAGVVIESEGRLAAYDLTASRRLALAAERSGSRIVMVRIAAQPRPSAAFTRWTIASAPSAPLPGAAPGRSMLLVRLDRRRGWAGGQTRWHLEWDSTNGFFRPLPAPIEAAPALPPPLPGAVVSLAGLRSGPASRAA